MSFQLSSISQLPVNRVAVKLTKDAERHLKSGHPWVYDKSVLQVKGEAKNGDLAIVFDQRKNRFLGCGLYDASSPIRIKLLHSGSPAKIDADWLNQKIDLSYSLRKPLMDSNTNAYRVIHGENDGLPAFIADLYADTLVIKLYSPIWIPYLVGMIEHLQSITAAENVVLRLSRRVQRDFSVFGLKDGMTLVGDVGSGEKRFLEYGVHFQCNVLHGHKTGFFLDQRHNRKFVGENSTGADVLDIFSYAGGFSVHALCGEASSVTSIDISAQAMKMAKLNVELNATKGKHHPMVADAFEGIEQLKRKGKLFDVVIVDPPSFAKKANEVDRALLAYARLHEAVLPLVSPHGLLLLSSCSARVSSEQFHAVCERSLRASNRIYNCLWRNQHDVDHPVGFNEGAYLKSGCYKLMR